MVILYSHQKGGVGKSTLAINHAYIKNYPILDLDSQNSSILFNKLREQISAPLLECFSVKDTDALKKLLHPYQKDVKQHIIVDSGGYDSQINRMALLLSDIIITPVGLSQIELFGLQKFRKVLQQAKEHTGKNYISHALINNVDSRAQSKIEEVKEYIKNNGEYFNLLDTIVHARANIKYAYGEGKTIDEFAPNSKASTEILNLTQEIEQKIS